MLSLFQDSEEYKQRKLTPFVPPKVTISELHRAIPESLFEKSTLLSLQYVARDIALSIAFYLAVIQADAWIDLHGSHFTWARYMLEAAAWVLYWVFQGLAFAGFWCLSHEAGHGSLSQYKWVNHIIGFTLHTFLMVPYFAWRATHKAHHNAANSVERDENYVPRTRSEYGLPPEKECQKLDYREIFEDTPLFTLGRMVLMQLLGWQSYLLFNTLGCPMYPSGTNHFSPSSALFNPKQRGQIIASDIGLAVMGSALYAFAYVNGFVAFAKLYLMPYLLANHWIVMATFLHHTDPTIPHYRRKEWSWLRGTLATVDRPLMGPLGRFFLHNVSHDHIAHHIFSSIPFYNQPQVTEIIKEILQKDYNYDSTNSFRALYRSFTECCFIEDNGDIVFYKNQDGKAQREVGTTPN
ncbi:hypothetical protein EIP86_011485 [Pleurotus ostreatoroseus]|nr:hypothetical protein EIP86_011485 [Pleurotus ostreatoroseus]